MTITTRAREKARDLILENNDAPVSKETLLALAYMAGWFDAEAATIASPIDQQAEVAHA